MSHDELSSSQLWDYAAYAALPTDGQRHEILAGTHFVNPAPNLYHQQLSRRIQFQLYTQIELAGLGVVLNAPADVELTPHDIVQPDLIVVTQSNLSILTPSRIIGIPDLLIEILSPGNPEHDLSRKRLVYERCGVPEYWIVMPDERRIVALALEHGRYVGLSPATDKIVMAGFPHSVVDLREVW